MNRPQAPLVSIASIPARAVELIALLNQVKESIARAIQQSDTQVNRAYLTGIAMELVQPALLFHASMDVRRLAAGCLSGILLRPETNSKQRCRYCQLEFFSFAALYAHEPKCDHVSRRNENAVQELVKMGFNQQRTRDSLAHNGFDVHRAHQELSSSHAPVKSGAPPEATVSTIPPILPDLVLRPQLAAEPALVAAPKNASKSLCSRVALTSSGSRPRTLSIHYAARECNIEAIKWFLQNGVKVDDRDEHGNTALYYAVLCGHATAVNFLFDHGAFLDMHEPEGARYMMAASQQSLRDIIRARAVNGKVKRIDDFIFFKPALAGKREVIASLLKAKGAAQRLNVKHKTGFTALDFAVLKGHKEVAQMLKQAGAWNTLLSDMQSLCECGDFPSAEFVVQDQIVLVHLPILETRVDFDALLAFLQASVEQPVTPSSSASPAIPVAAAASALPRFIVRHPGIRKSDLCAILSWIYSGNTFISDPGSHQILTIFAEKLDFAVLRRQLKRDLSRDALGKIAETHVAHTYERLHNDKRHMDVEFEAGSGTTFYAHKAMLSARSAYFHAMFHSAMKESSSNVLPLDPNVSDEAFQILLWFIYTDTVGDVTEITGEVALELIALSAQWILPPLRALAESLVLTEFAIDWADAIELWQYAKLYGAADFAAECHAVLMSHQNPHVTTHASWHVLSPDEQKQILNTPPRKANKKQQ